MTQKICNDYNTIVSYAINQLKEELGEAFSMETINLAELGRRTGISRSKLRTWKKNGFVFNSYDATKRVNLPQKLDGYEDKLNSYLKRGIKNATVCFERLQKDGYPGSLTTIKRYISAHKYLLPARPGAIMPHGTRGRRYTTAPGYAFQMDWGFCNVTSFDGTTKRLSCLGMICHHCGKFYIEFFPNARQENLFIAMIHAFQYLGVPQEVLTDNMKSVVTKHGSNGEHVWQSDYGAFMKAVGFITKLCKPRHPYTKGKVERLMRYIKENFLPGRTFVTLLDLNKQAQVWCEEKNCKHRKGINDIPQNVHATVCTKNLKELDINSSSIYAYLCPERKVSFDGFVAYDGARYGIPFQYSDSVVRVHRVANTLQIFTQDLSEQIVVHTINENKDDVFYSGTLVKTKIDKFLNVSGSRHCSIEQQCREVALCWRDVPDG